MKILSDEEIKRAWGNGTRSEDGTTALQMNFEEAIENEAIKTASKLEALDLELREVQRKKIKVFRELELLNELLKYHGEKGIDIKAILKGETDG